MSSARYQLITNVQGYSRTRPSTNQPMSPGSTTRVSTSYNTATARTVMKPRVMNNECYTRSHADVQNGGLGLHPDAGRVKYVG